MKEVTKLVLPVAGLGTRLRPLTLHTPKALVKVGGKPLLEYALEEAVSAGIREVTLVISPIHERQFKEYIRAIKPLFPSLTFYIRKQLVPMGNGHALILAADIIKNEPFAVRFCDDILLARTPVLAALKKSFSRNGFPLVLLERVPKKDVSKYGVVDAELLKGPNRSGACRIFGVVEKPAPEEAPSDLTIVGGYVLTSDILTILKKLNRRIKGSPIDGLLLTHAFESHLLAGGSVYGYIFRGKRLDCGTLRGIEIANKFLDTKARKTL